MDKRIRNPLTKKKKKQMLIFFIMSLESLLLQISAKLPMQITW